MLVVCFLLISRCYTHEEHAKVSLRTWVNIVYGKMTAILRKEKCVLVNGNFRVPYDHLIIATGKQFQVPKPTGADIDAGTNNDNLPSSPEQRLLTQPPRNLFLVNDSYQAAVALYKVENSLMKKDSMLFKSICLLMKIEELFYGHCTNWRIL